MFHKQFEWNTIDENEENQPKLSNAGDVDDKNYVPMPHWTIQYYRNYSHFADFGSKNKHELTSTFVISMQWLHKTKDAHLKKIDNNNT